MKSILALFFAASVMLGAAGACSAFAQPGAPQSAAVDDKDVIAAAEFAIKAQQQAMKKADAKAPKLELVKITSAEKQVVAGLNYILTLKVKEGDKSRTAEVKVWEQAWRKEPYQLTKWQYVKEKESGPKTKAEGTGGK